MPRRSDLLVEAIAGAVAAVAVAALSERVHAAQRRIRSERRPGSDGAPHDWRDKVGEFLAMHIAFRSLMHATRLGVRRVI